jgi:hypothetical protein
MLLCNYLRPFSKLPQSAISSSPSLPVASRYFNDTQTEGGLHKQRDATPKTKKIESRRSKLKGILLVLKK